MSDFDTDKIWYVQWSVDGFPGTHKSGPFTKDDADSELQDVNGYEGVHAFVTPMPDENAMQHGKPQS